MARVARISIDRLFNLGDHEQVKYSVSVDVAGTESAEKVFENLEKVMEALRPIRESEIQEIGYLRTRIAQYEGEYRQKLQKELEETTQSISTRQQRHEKALRTLNELGGTVTWVDAKKEWGEELGF